MTKIKPAGWRPHPAIVITLLAVASQAVGVLTQVVIAALLGASGDMDAFLVAFTLPQYLGAVIIGSLGFVLIPIFSDYRAANDERAGWRVISSVLNTYVLVLGVVVVVGLLNRDWIITKMAPGLTPEVAQKASRVALITWPTVVPTGVAAILIGAYQTLERFTWAAFAPLLGAAINLAIVLAFGASTGATGLAVAAAAGVVGQVVMLLPELCRDGRYVPSFDLGRSGLRRVSALLLPLVIVNVVAKSSPLVDRYLASFMSQGSISQLGYAFRLLSLAAGVISTGVGTIVFQRMAADAAKADTQALRGTIARHLVAMWIVTAPVAMIGIALSVPLARVLLERGEFAGADAVRVGELLRIYLLSLAGGCLATISGRAFYALKDTWTLSVFGTAESVLYVGYTVLLSHRFGAAGVALGYVVFVNGSLTWQLLLLRRKLGAGPGPELLKLFLRIGFCAALAATAAALTARALPQHQYLQLLAGSAAGTLVFLFLCKLLEIEETQVLWRALIRRRHAA